MTHRMPALLQARSCALLAGRVESGRDANAGLVLIKLGKVIFDCILTATATATKQPDHGGRIGSKNPVKHWVFSPLPHHREDEYRVRVPPGAPILGV